MEYLNNFYTVEIIYYLYITYFGFYEIGVLDQMTLTLSNIWFVHIITLPTFPWPTALNHLVNI